MKRLPWPCAAVVPCMLAAALCAQEQSERAAEASHRGLAAARQQEWALAIRYFGQARRHDPEAAPILFNLALAHDRAGHELHALAWYRAYLAAAPQSEQAAAVRRRIIELDVSAEAKVLKLVGAARKAAAQLTNDRSTRSDVDEAAARILGAVGDFHGAVQIAEQIPGALARYGAVSSIFQRSVPPDQLDAAARAVVMLSDGLVRAYAMAEVAAMLAQAGEIDAARENLRGAQRIMETLGSDASPGTVNEIAYRSLATGWAFAGDFAAARAALDRIPSTNMLPYVPQRSPKERAALDQVRSVNLRRQQISELIARLEAEPRRSNDAPTRRSEPASAQWTDFAQQELADPILTDLPEHIETLKQRPPLEAIEQTLGAAGRWAGALAATRGQKVNLRLPDIEPPAVAADPPPPARLEKLPVALDGQWEVTQSHTAFGQRWTSSHSATIRSIEVGTLRIEYLYAGGGGDTFELSRSGNQLKGTLRRTWYSGHTATQPVEGTVAPSGNRIELRAEFGLRLLDSSKGAAVQRDPDGDPVFVFTRPR